MKKFELQNWLVNFSYNIVRMNLPLIQNPISPEKYFLTFSSPNVFTLSIYNSKKNWDGQVYYSTDSLVWKEWDGKTVLKSTKHRNKQYIYVCGSNNSFITGSNNQNMVQRWILDGSEIECDGNIEVLLDFQTVADGNHPRMAQNCFFGMFADCVALTKTPDLLSTSLSYACYGSMFYNCTALREISELPATVLAPRCYYNMFCRCISLTKLPKLPAVTFTDGCYNSMFLHCKNIKLSSEQIEKYNIAYRIPSEGEGGKVPISSFAGMFTNTGGTFTETPEVNTIYYLYNENAAENPDDPTEQVKNFIIFSSKESFTLETFNKKKSWDGVLYYSTDNIEWNEWNGIDIITSQEANNENIIYLRGLNNTIITGPVSGNEGYYTGDPTKVMSWKLTSNNSIECYGNIETLLDYQKVEKGEHPIMGTGCFFGIFSHNNHLASSPELPALELSEYCYRYMFDGCSSLIEMPKLPANILKKYCYSFMFNECTKLTKPQELQATTLADFCYQSMFFNCRSLLITPILPATQLAKSCYRTMFSGCESLITLPRLLAANLEDACYFGMFNNCGQIRLSATKQDNYQISYKIPFVVNGNNKTNALVNMFNSTGGSFVGTPEINKIYYTSNSIV